MTTAATVIHPRQPGMELLEPGVRLDARLLSRLKQFGITSMWVHHDATADLDRAIDPNLGQARRAAYEQIKDTFARASEQTVHTGDVLAYRQVVMDLVCELMSNRQVAGLTEQLVGGPAGLFTHSANVAYISVLLALQVESYVVKQRSRLSNEHARDFTNLGIGAMLHDVGKVGLGPAAGAHELHLLTTDGPEAQEPNPDYREHPRRGYLMLRGANVPASATQAVLNHHQRWDGQGFPDMGQVTAQRKSGTQSGEQIHIFSRLVATANVLDNLLRDGEGRTRPPVAALKALAGAGFEGWLDPTLREAALRCLPPFAVGSRVTLSDGRPAAVVGPCLEQPCRPVVRLLNEADRDADGRYPTLELRAKPELTIAECGGQDVRAHLFELEERNPRRVQRQAG